MRFWNVTGMWLISDVQANLMTFYKSKDLEFDLVFIRIFMNGYFQRNTLLMVILNIRNMNHGSKI